MRILIAYFSRRGENYVGTEIVNLPIGNTEIVAGAIQRLTGGDTFRIETAKEYSAIHSEVVEVSRRELAENARPELVGRVANMVDYDAIILGYPNWWGTMPMAVFSFLESYDLSGKKIMPFCTHEGSWLGQSCNDIKKVCPGTTVSMGLAIPGSAVREAEEEVSAWLKLVGVIE